MRAAIASLALLLAFNVRAEESSAERYRVFRQGRPASLTAQQSRAAQKRLRKFDSNLNHAFETTAYRGRCDRYRGALAETSRQINSVYEQYTATNDADAKLLTRARFEVLVSALRSLHGIFQGGYESGIGIFTREPEPSCVRDRGAIAAIFDPYVSTLKEISEGTFGLPGFETLTRDEEDLLRLTDKFEIHRGRVSLAANLAYLGIGAFLWEVGPPLALLGVRAAIGEVPVMLARPAAQFGLRAVGGVADYAAYTYTMDKITPPPPTGPEVMIGGLEEKLWMIEQLLKSPLESPELDYIYFTTAKGQLASRNREWLNAHHTELGLGDGWPSVVREVTEALTGIGEPVAIKLDNLRARLLHEYGLESQCETGLVQGLTAPNCLIGLRHLLSAFHHHELDKFAPRVTDALRVTIASRNAEVFGDDQVECQILPDQSPEAIADKVNSLLASGPFRYRADVRQVAIWARERLGKVFANAVAFRAHLTQTQIWESADRLARIFTENSELRTRLPEQIVIGTRTRALFEHHLQATIELDIRASDQAWIAQLAMPNPKAASDRFADARRRTDSEKARLFEARAWTASCEPSGFLTQELCAQTLARLNDFLATRADVQTQPANILIAGLDDVGQPLSEIEVDQTRVLIVRTDFRYGDLIDFARLRGWLSLRPAN